jgi:voltage-gated potassium channel
MPHTPSLNAARAELSRRLEHWFELPMAIFGAVWLLLLVIELVSGPTRAIDILTNVIWAVFIVEFSARFLLTTRKSTFLRRNWITLIALALPAFRVFRFGRVVRLMRVGRAARGVRVARLLTSFSRGMRTLGVTMRHRGIGYVVALTTVVLLLGAAGMYAFERDSHTAFETFGASLWWTAMLLTTMGSEFWPRTPEGRFVCLLLSIYAFAVFGYITATLASHFIEVDASRARDRAARIPGELRR